MMLVVSHVDLRRIDELAARRKAATLGASDLVRASDRRGELLRAFAGAMVDDGVLWVLAASAESRAPPQGRVVPNRCVMANHLHKSRARCPGGD